MAETPEELLQWARNAKEAATTRATEAGQRATEAGQKATEAGKRAVAARNMPTAPPAMAAPACDTETAKAVEAAAEVIATAIRNAAGTIAKGKPGR